VEQSSNVRLRRWFFAPLPFAVLASTCSHGSVVVAMLFGAGGHARAAGEGGRTGAGDTSVDVSVAGDPQPVSAATSSPPPPEETKTDDESKEAALQPRPQQKPTVTREKPATPQTQQGTAESTNGGKLPGPVRVGTAGDGETVEGQRALLPSAARCNDPVEGKWEALKYNARISTWVRFTLTLHRDASGALSGTILSRSWGGTVFDREPPPCSFGGFDMTVSMPASGRADASGHITFGSSRYSVVATRCLMLDTSYAPDNFSGSIDGTRQEFQSLNNDGAYDINVPYVFRRTGC
jgi:hypothetical protein